MLNTLELKDNLHRMIVETEDPMVLQKISAFVVSLLKDYHPDAAFIKQYESQMKPMTRAELVRRAMDSEEDIASGRVYDLEEYLETVEAEL